MSDFLRDQSLSHSLNCSEKEIIACESFENFSAYIRHYATADTAEDIPHDIMDELQNIKHKKPMDGPKLSPNLVRYALLLHNTTPQLQAYTMLLNQFPI